MDRCTLLLRLAGPLQSWGIDSKFNTRRTENEPSKSGVIGLLAAALGRKREMSNEDLNALRFGVRIDQPGIVLRDFHKAEKDPWEHKDLTKKNKDTYITNRYYLQDAVFLAGLESEECSFLESLAWAVQHPKYPLFLGRRSCPPTLPILIGICHDPLEEALKKAEWFGNAERKTSSSINERELLLLVEPSENETCRGYRRDLPISFDSRKRTYGYRGIKVMRTERTANSENYSENGHDPFLELEG